MKWILLETLIVSQLIKTFSAAYGTGRLINVLQQNATSSFHELHEFTLHPPLYVFKTVLILYPHYMINITV